MRSRRVSKLLTLCVLVAVWLSLDVTAAFAWTKPMVSAGGYHTVGLKSDGTFVVTGRNVEGQASSWGSSGITAVSAGGYHTVWLHSYRGTVSAAGDSAYHQTSVSGWTGITAVSAGGYHTVGVKSDRTVVATGRSTEGQTIVSGWTGITAVSAGGYHTVGLRSDGTVVATGLNNYGQIDVSGWTRIAAVSAGSHHTVGVRSDGTVVATGINNYGQTDVSGWTGIIAASAGTAHTVGLKSDGTVVATGYNNDGRANVSSWRLGWVTPLAMSTPLVFRSKPRHGKYASFSAVMTPGQAPSGTATKLLLYHWETTRVKKLVRGHMRRVKVKYWRLRYTVAMKPGAAGPSTTFTAKRNLKYAGKWQAVASFRGGGGYPASTSSAKAFTVK